MAPVDRGPERRAADDAAEFPLLLPDGRLIPEERRRQTDRRRNAFISHQYLCRGVPYGVVESVLERFAARELGAGEVLLSPGQENHYLFMLLSGRLQVHLDAARSRLGFPIEPGECIGEMSIIDGKPTSAYVVAEEPSTVLAVHGDVFWNELAPIPGVARNLLRLLAERMRTRNDVTLRALEQELHMQHLQKELSVAQRIQADMLPGQDPLFPDHPQVDAYAVMKPARDVGGDFYDAFALDEHRICVAVGDVSGKGIPAALFMVRALTALRMEMLRGVRLEDLFTRLNRLLCENNPSCMFVSMFLAVIDLHTHEMICSNAGHNPPLLASSADFAFIATEGGVILGVLEEAEFQVSRLRLRQGDSLVLYTDGVTEAQNGDGEFFTAARLRELVSSSPRTGAKALVHTIEEGVERFASGVPQSDDITILALTVTETPVGRA